MTSSNMLPTMIVSDLDGTLVRHGGPTADGSPSIDPGTSAALIRAHDRGIRVLFATGRPPYWMADVSSAFGATLVGVDGAWPVICANGALVYDLARGEPLLTRLINPDIGIAVVSQLRERLPGTVFAVEAGVHGWSEFRHEAAYDNRWNKAAVVVDDPVLLFSSPVVKLLARHPDHSSDRMLDAAASSALELVSMTHSTPGGEGLLEIGAHGVSKASTAALLALEWGINPADVVAFGDMPNDIDLLRWAGRSWAVGEAHDDVRAAASMGWCAGPESAGVAGIVLSLLDR